MWHIASAGRFYDANEDTVIYYDPNSGDTHLLTDLAAFVVEKIKSGANSQTALLEHLAPHLDGEQIDPQLLLDGVLQELQHLDIARHS